MHAEDIRAFCLSLKGADESFPFGEGTLVFKVMGKMFCLMGLNHRPLRVNVKCDPEHALALREQYTGVLPGYHMSKANWNTLEFDGSFPDEEAMGWISDSYALVVSGLSKKLQNELHTMP